VAMEWCVGVSSESERRTELVVQSAERGLPLIYAAPCPSSDGKEKGWPDVLSVTWATE
jgi:hypothetical protein